jgi:hypothetical protein
MIQIRMVVFLLLLVGTTLGQTANQEHETHGITLSICAGYFANPWDGYNATLETVSRYIMLDSYYYRPRGQYDKITGDLLRRIALGYQFLPGLQVRVTGQTGTVKSTFETWPDVSIPEYRSYPSWRSVLDATFSSYGLELAGEISLTRKISLHAAAGIDQWHARISYRSALDYWSHGPIPEDFNDTRATFKDAVTGYHAGIGADIRIYGPVSFTVSAVWRQARFDDLRGSGQQEANGEWIYFETQLVRSAHYYGPNVIRVTRPAGYNNYYLRLPGFYYLSLDLDDPLRELPAQIDLTALGIQFGFNVEF